MKLLNRTTSVYLMISVPIFLVSMLIIFFLIRHFNLKHVETNLKEEHAEITQRAQHIKQYFIEDELSDDLFIVECKVDSIIGERFSTIIVFDSLENEYKPYRQLETTQNIAGKNYKITIRKSLVENSTLIYSISISVFLILVLITVAFLYFNRMLSKKLWMPFYEILNATKNFKPGQKYSSLSNKKIAEFRQLDEAITEMTQRINKDFFVFKEFIDIVSHEYQTPLAVISNKSELLMQNQSLNDEDYSYIHEIIESVSKLKRLNQSLLLLSRIDNNQFEEKEHLSVKTMIKMLLMEKKLQIEHKNIEVKTAFEGDITLNIHPILCEILFGNLLQNAIRHNLASGGRIIIEIRKNNFHIYNTGSNPGKISNDIFSKFIKLSKSKESTGLGLSIVKSICDQYGFSVFYEFLEEKEEHHFLLRF